MVFVHYGSSRRHSGSSEESILQAPRYGLPLVSKSSRFFEVKSRQVTNSIPRRTVTVGAQRRCPLCKLKLPRRKTYFATNAIYLGRPYLRLCGAILSFSCHAPLPQSEPRRPVCHSRAHPRCHGLMYHLLTRCPVDHCRKGQFFPRRRALSARLVADRSGRYCSVFPTHSDSLHRSAIRAWHC